MPTLVLRVNPRRPDMGKIKIAAEFIRNGGLVAFPTETVYGLGADALNPQAIRTLFEAKRRPLDNPPIVHIADFSAVDKLVKGISLKARRLMELFWPGPLTLILERSDTVPSVTVAGLETIAIRMPRHNVALALIKESGCSIAAPSANLAGKPSSTSAKHVLDDLDCRIDAVLDAGPTQVGVESTVLDLTVDPPQVLRPGGTSYETLLKVLGKVELNPVANAEKPVPIEKARSPGVKHKHYSPNAELVVVEGDLGSMSNKIMELVKSYSANGKRIGVLCTDETVERYRADVVKSMGGRHNLASVAKNLFRLLREFDKEHVDVILAEGIPTEELGLAVMNRLRKASGYRIIS